MTSSYRALVLEIAMQGAHYRAIGPGLGRRVKGHQIDQIDQIGERGYSIVYIYYAVGLDLVTPSSDELAGVATVPPGTMPSEAAAGISLLDTAAGLLGGAEPGRAGAGGSLGKGAGVFMGEGLPPVPGRLVDRIRKWVY